MGAHRIMLISNLILTYDKLQAYTMKLQIETYKIKHDII